jgi:23S rRNA maturation-related 3'-5' exoribonuclease YhaM
MRNYYDFALKLFFKRKKLDLNCMVHGKTYLQKTIADKNIKVSILLIDNENNSHSSTNHYAIFHALKMNLHEVFIACVKSKVNNYRELPPPSPKDMSCFY